MQIGISTVFLLESIGTFYPGTNLFALVIISGIVGLGFAAVWSIMSAAMPRSGGDYVWISRILNRVPGVGFSYAVTYGLAFAIAFNMGFQVWLFTSGVISPTFAGLGLIYKSASMVNFGNWTAAGNGLFIVGLLLVALAIITVAAGTRMGSRIINVLFFFSLVVTLLWIVVGFAYNSSTFQSAFDSQFGAGAYSHVATLGGQAGFSGFSFNLLTTLQVGFSLGYFSLYSNFQYPVWASGEIKRASMVWRPYFAAIVVTGILYFLLISGLFHMFGANWLGDISTAAANSSTSGSLPISVAPTFTLFMTLVVKNDPILVFLINAGLIAGTFTWFVVPYIAFSRLIFSMSFDRVLPAAFADVNERLRIPLKALLLSVVLVVIWFSQYVYGLFWNPSNVSFATVFGSVTAVAPAAWTVAALVFAFFPFINKTLYERAMPASFKKNIGLPLITWLGLFVAVTQAWATYGYLTTAVAQPPVGAVAAILVLLLGGFLFYYVIAAFRKSQGIELKNVFSEIPPE